MSQLNDKRQRSSSSIVLLNHRARCLHDESGTLTFEVMVSNDDEAKSHIYEVYVDAAAFEAHLNSSIRQFREETAGMVAGIVVAKSTLAQ